MEENVIEVKNLVKKYQEFSLKDICFSIPYGSVVGFVGENGAGKSTVIRSILGLCPIESGEIEILGQSVRSKLSDASWKEEIGVVLDECFFPGEMRIKHVGNIMKNIYRTWNQGQYAAYIDRFQLPMNKKVRELSKGMKMKLSIAVALSHASKVLILDEATSGLDPVIRNEILDIFQEFVLNEEHAVFLSSHITSDIEKIADYIMLIHEGRILLFESKDELLYQYGLLKCTAGQADRIPRQYILGRENSAFGSSVLLRNKAAFFENGLGMIRASAQEPEPVMDRVTIEDVLLYMVKYGL